MIGRNNPLNIRYNPCNYWFGQSGKTQGFVNFRDLKFGIRAAAILLIRSYRYIEHGDFKPRTYSQLIHRFAPSSENPTGNYVKYVCDKCSCLPFDCPVSVEDFATLIYYMWCFEQGSKNPPTLTVADIEEIIVEFELDKYCKNG